MSREFRPWFLLFALTVLVLSPVAMCGSIPYTRLAEQPFATREAQLDAFADVSKPEFDSYLGFGWLLFPMPSQQKLESPYGTHPGFAFRHRFALFIQNTLDSSSDYKTGLGWWVERHGWDTEDFLLMPKYSDFGLVRDIHTFAMTVANAKQSWGVAAGLQWQNPEYVGKIYEKEGDTLWWFGQATFDKFTVQAEFHQSEWSLARVNLDLADRAVRGGDSTGWKTYLPDIEGLMVRNDEDPLRVQVSQNLFRRMIFAKGSWWVKTNEDRWVSVMAYSDPSHLLGMEIGARILHDGELVWGAGLEMPFLRVSCNLPREYEQFFKNRGPQFMVEFHMDLVTENKKAIFARSGVGSAPMETDKVKKERKFDENPQPDNKNATKDNGGVQ